MDPHTLDDRELYGRVAEGAEDHATWTAFVNRFSRLCYHAIHRVIARRPHLGLADADELFQRFFEHLLAHDRAVLKRYRGANGCAPGTYLAHVAAFQALEYSRERERASRGHVGGEEAADTLARTPDHTRPAPEELEQHEVVTRVQRALDGLSASDKLLYQLHYVRGMSLVEVARFTSRSETALHVQHHRLKERLKKVLAAEWDAGHLTG